MQKHRPLVIPSGCGGPIVPGAGGRSRQGRESLWERATEDGGLVPEARHRQSPLSQRCLVTSSPKPIELLKFL